jgi:hypothetical protein
VVDGADPANRYAHYALWLFPLPGVGVLGPWHAEDPVWFVSIITGHRLLQWAMLPTPAPVLRMTGLHGPHKRSGTRRAQPAVLQATDARTGALCLTRESAEAILMEGPFILRISRAVQPLGIRSVVSCRWSGECAGVQLRRSRVYRLSMHCV